MATPTGAAPAASTAHPAPPTGVPSNFVWNPGALGGQGGWTSPDGDTTKYAVFTANGQALTSDGNGGFSAPNAGKVAAPNKLAEGFTKVKNTISSALNGPPTTNLQAVGTRAVGDAGGFRGLNVAGGEATLGQSLADTISGKMPSAADAALQAETAKNAGAQLGFASGLGGLNAALARRTAAENIGRINQAAVGQGVQLRAKEIEDAQSKQGALLGQEHGQQMSEEQLAEQAYRDQLAAQSANRGQNMQLGGAFAQGLGSGGSRLPGDSGGGAFSFTPHGDELAKPPSDY